MKLVITCVFLMPVSCMSYIAADRYYHYDYNEPIEEIIEEPGIIGGTIRGAGEFVGDVGQAVEDIL